MKTAAQAGELLDTVHSITSPRSRNLARATVPTNPKKAMISAASK